MASVALGLGIGSVLIPLLTIPGIILGVKSLLRIKRQPWLGGRGRSIAAIVTSAILGPLVAIPLVLGITHGLTHEDMTRVKALVTSEVQTAAQQQTGTTPNLNVQCPSSEPKRTGTTFSCLVTDIDTNRSLVVQVREIDHSGDVVLTPESSAQPSASASPTTPAATSPSTPAATSPTTSAEASPGLPITGMPTGDEDVIVSVDSADRTLTVDANNEDVRYAACPSLQAVSASGQSTSLSAISPGEFATLNIDPEVPCLKGVSVLATPQPPQCQSSGFDGQITAIWEGFNTSSHSVLYMRTDTNGAQPIVGIRWCEPPTLVGTNGSAMTFSQIPPGTTVQFTFSGGMQGPWLGSVTAQP